jgi:hypothetical protein
MWDPVLIPHGRSTDNCSYSPGKSCCPSYFKASIIEQLVRLHYRTHSMQKFSLVAKKFIMLRKREDKYCIDKVEPLDSFLS